MKKLTLSLTTFCLLMLPVLSGCTGGGGQPQSNPNLPNPGFTIVTQGRTPFGFEYPMPFTTVQGTQRRPLPPEATGTLRDFRGTSGGGAAILPVANGVAPAFWAIGEDNGPCAGMVAFGGVRRGDYNYLTCSSGLTFPFGFQPVSLNANGMESTWKVTGAGMDTEYGMPVLQVYDMYGNFVAQVPATECGYTPESDEAPASTWMSGSTAALIALPSGSYTANIVNQSSTSDESGGNLGFVDFSVFAYEPPPDPDPCNDGGLGYNPQMPRPICEANTY